jgi:hypothetical protein
MNKSLKWSQVRGNPYLQTINPLMLLDSGYTIDKLYRFVSDEDKEMVTVIYDKSFVIMSIIKEVIEPLKGVDKELIKDILLEAVDFYFNSKEQSIPSFVTERNRLIYLWEQYQKLKNQETSNDEQI